MFEYLTLGIALLVTNIIDQISSKHIGDNKMCYAFDVQNWNDNRDGWPYNLTHAASYVRDGMVCTGARFVGDNFNFEFNVAESEEGGATTPKPGN